MLTPEQSRIIGYLKRRLMTPLEDLARACWPGASIDLLKRALADLEWLGYVVVYYDPTGEPQAIQPTERGMRCLV